MVAALYADYQNWDKIFPLIKKVHLVEQREEKTILAIDHVEGRFPNVLRKISGDTFELWEVKQKYSGIFLNKFESVSQGTKYTVRAEIRLNGFYRLLELFAGGLVRTKIQRYLIEPLKFAAEAN